MLLQGKVALITGAGNGIGRATARLFASQGAGVGVVDIVGELADEVASDIRTGGGRAVAVRADVGNEANARAAVDAVAGEFKGLNILINNAGLPSGDEVPIEDMSLGGRDRSSE